MTVTLPTTVRATVAREVMVRNPFALNMVCDQLGRVFAKVTGRDATAFLLQPPAEDAALHMRDRYEVMATDDPVALLVGLGDGQVRWRPI